MVLILTITAGKCRPWSRIYNGSEKKYLKEINLLAPGLLTWHTWIARPMLQWENQYISVNVSFAMALMDKAGRTLAVPGTCILRYGETIVIIPGQGYSGSQN